MSFALVIFHDPAPVTVPAAELASLRAALARVPGLGAAMIHTPAAARDTYVDDGMPPPLGLQLHFDRLEELELAAVGDGVLARLPGLLPSLVGIPAEAQAFWCRTWPVAQPATGARHCSYVVHYPGPAADPDAWLAYYLAGHPPLFQRLPGIRRIEILTPVDWVCGLALRKARHMQRNRVVFDSPEALATALASPVRHELRADFHRFPPFEGGNFHYPMWTETLTPAGVA